MQLGRCVSLTSYRQKDHDEAENVAVSLNP